MGWELRGGRRYYYRKKRQVGHVRSEYVGRGLVGELCAAADEQERWEQARRQEVDRRTRHAEAEIDRQLDDFESLFAGVIDATLRAAGLHNHKGQWRKKRCGRTITSR